MPKPRADRQLKEAAILFAALGDATRLALVRRLAGGRPASITTLTRDFRVSRQAVTKHLHSLAQAGILDGWREGREHIWALNPARLDEVRRSLDVIARGWDDALGRLKAHVEAE